MSTLTANVDLLAEAAAALAAVDGDMAREENGVGYSQADTHFGHALAATPPGAWTDAVIDDAHRTLWKYRRQLLEVHGVDINPLGPPERDGSGGRTGVHAIDHDGENFVIRFPYDPTLVGKVRDLPGRRWDGTARVWTAPQRAADVLETFAAANGFGITERAQAKIDEGPGDWTPSATGSVSLDSLRLRIAFDYDPDLVQAVKRLPERRWNSAARYWVVPVEHVVTVRRFAEEHGLDIADEVKALPGFDDDGTPVATPAEDGGALVRIGDAGLVPEFRQAVPEAEWSGDDAAWHVPPQALVDLHAYAREAILDDEGVLERTREVWERIALSRADDADVEVDGLGMELRSFQRAGVKYAADVKRTFIADEMGLGKTVQALAALKHTDAFPALVVVPASLKINWKREAAKWLPGHTIDVLYGTTPQPRLQWADITIVNYDILDEWSEVIPEGEFRGLVCDESQYVKNPQSRRSIAALRVRRRLADDPTVLLLSGTAADNHVADLAHQLLLLGEDILALFGGGKGFERRWGKGPGRASALNRRLRAHCYVRRMKDAVTDLPPKQWAEVAVEGSEHEMRVYREAERNVVAHIAKRAAERAEERGDDPTEAALDAAARASAAEHLVAVTELRKLAAKAKLADARSWLRDFLRADPDRKVVVFGHHRTTMDSVRDLADGCMIVGGMTAAKRDEMVERFQNDPETRIIGCALDAAGVGLTLTAASDVLFIEQGWTPAKMDQAIDRCHRIGQHDSVTGWTMLVPDTIDEMMLNMIAQKRTLLGAANEGNADVDEEAAKSVLGDVVAALLDKAGTT